MAEIYQGKITITRVAGTKAASGNNTLIAAPAAGYRLVIKGWYVQNESDGHDHCHGERQQVKTITAIRTEPGRRNWPRPEAFNEWRLTAATALILNLSGANSHGYWLEYWTEAV